MCGGESVCLHAGGLSAGDGRADELRPHRADELRPMVFRDAPWTGSGVPSSRLEVAVAYVRGVRGNAPRTDTSMCLPSQCASKGLVVALGMRWVCHLPPVGVGDTSVRFARVWHSAPFGSYVELRVTCEEWVEYVMNSDLRDT